MVIPPSVQQLAILDALHASRANLLINAAPGSGKTTTLALIGKALPQDGSRHVALAFASQNAEDFKTKLPYWVESSTFHKLCKSAIEASWPAAPKLEVGKYGKPSKTKRLLKQHFPDIHWERHNDLLKVLSLMKQQAEPCDVEQLAEHYGIGLEPREAASLNALLGISDKEKHTLDFDDMLRFAGRDASVRFPRYATVMVDECQDTNGIQRVVLEKLLGTASEAAGCSVWQPAFSEIQDTKRCIACGLLAHEHEVRARLIVVGDPFQAIYAFRGADANAMRRIAERFDCTALPLNVSWRCAVAVCDEANRILENTI